LNIEHRLQHAARELREVPIAVPPLRQPAPASRPWARVPALATPMLVPLLFVAGALFAVGAIRADTARPIRSDIPAVAQPPAPAPRDVPAPVVDDADVTVDEPDDDVPSVLDELRMIAELNTMREAPASTSAPSTPPPSVRPATGVGPI